MHYIKGFNKVMTWALLLGIPVFGFTSCDPEEINQPPQVANALQSLTLLEGFGTETVNISGVFTDGDGDALTITATINNQAVVTALISGNTLTLTEVGLGTSTVTLLADDGREGTVTTSFSVTVNEPENTSPTVTNPLADISLEEGFGTRMVEVGASFSDAETQRLIFTATSSSEAVVTVSVEGPRLTIAEVGPGRAILTVTATDEGGATAMDDFEVVVNAGDDGNQPPTVANALADVSLTAGFGTQPVSLTGVFADADDDALSYSATSGNTAVVTVSVSGTMITLTEAGEGATSVTVTADDGNGGTASDDFVVEVGTTACNNDNSINLTERETCNRTPSTANQYSETVNGDVRTISTNQYPNHNYTIALQSVSALNTSTVTRTVDATPALAGAPTGLLTADNRPRFRFGVALNGVPFDPAPAEPFIFTDANTGEYNWDWVFEPNYNLGTVKLDCATAHVQPDGTYHYHGDPLEYVETIATGLGDGTTVPTEVVHVGWAADGFPIVYRYGPDANGSFGALASSWQLKSGNRPGDGDSAPCGAYNGKYSNDFEYVAGSGDLDECNGIAETITVGGETFGYYYVVTEEFPIVPRCFSGTPDSSFGIGP